jgi:hypothetical protein
MGAVRNGARTFLNLSKKICDLSHLPGFRPGMANILGPSVADDILVPFEGFCSAVETAIALDNHFNKVDTAPETTGDEDLTIE